MHLHVHYIFGTLGNKEEESINFTLMTAQFACNLRMTKHGGMDDIRTPPGSCCPAALFYDRKVRMKMAKNSTFCLLTRKNQRRFGVKVRIYLSIYISIYYYVNIHI